MRIATGDWVVNIPARCCPTALRAARAIRFDGGDGAGMEFQLLRLGRTRGGLFDQRLHVERFAVQPQSAVFQAVGIVAAIDDVRPPC
ncbi:hypothetical protein [Kaistia sp. UC242_56]|uniref:hypothetical protein n=1 Tax=Kaistia sp. UC242_56 TaxID=3374625 RepID=UPI00378762CB